MNHLRNISLLTIMCTVALGCGGGSDLPELGQVSGVVTVDGQPTEGLTVSFEPTGAGPSTGTTDKEGKYTLFYNPNAKGGVVGQHKVRISQANLAELEGDPIAIPAKFDSATTLTADVKAGENSFDFNVETK